MPPPGRLVADPGRVPVAIPILVRPCRLTRDVVAGESVGIRREERRHLGADGGVKIVLGNEGDDLVTFVSPGGRGIWACQRDAEKNAREEKKLWGSMV